MYQIISDVIFSIPEKLTLYGPMCARTIQVSVSISTQH